MPIYNMTAVIDATQALGEFEADTPEDAMCDAYEKVGPLGLCHACAGKVEVTECISMVAEAEDGSLTEDSTEARLRLEIERLKAKVKDLEVEAQMKDLKIKDLANNS